MEQYLTVIFLEPDALPRIKFLQKFLEMRYTAKTKGTQGYGLDKSCVTNKIL